MRTRAIVTWLLGGVVAGVLTGVSSLVAEEQAPATPPDPLAGRKHLLARWDEEIDRQCARAHLDARRVLDEVMPQPYLGIDADPEAGGMKVTRVVAATTADDVGLQVGDVILEFAGTPTPSAVALGGAIRRTRIGDRVRVKVRRAGVESELALALRARPEEDEDEDEGAPPPPAPKPVSFDFTGDALEATPAWMDLRLGGHGAPPRYLVHAEDEGNRFLAQDDDDPTGIRFPMAIVKDWKAADAVVRVRLRMVGGRQDRAAGVVVRWKDESNYLVARVNGVEGDLRIFRVVNGLRRTLPGARAEVPAEDAGWHVLEIRAEGPKITATFDDAVSVSSYDTYVSGDRVGLWTKSDSRTAFDDLSLAAAAH